MSSGVRFGWKADIGAVLKSAATAGTAVATSRTDRRPESVMEGTPPRGESF